MVVHYEFSPGNKTFYHVLFSHILDILSDSPFEQEALSIHNRYRTMHRAPALTLSCDMSKNAADYARTLADMDTLVQSGYTERPNQGENLSLGCHGSGEQTAEEAIKTWYVRLIFIGRG